MTDLFDLPAQEAAAPAPVYTRVDSWACRCGAREEAPGPRDGPIPCWSCKAPMYLYEPRWPIPAGVKARLLR